MVSATHSCDELVLRGSLYLGDNALFDLSVTQAQDCTRTGGSVDTFTTTTSGGFTVDGTRLVLHPSGTGIQLTGTTSSATVDLQLPLQAFSVAGLELPQQQPLGRQYGNHE